MKYVLVLFLCLICVSVYAQPPAGTFKSRVYGNRITYTNKYGRVIGASKNYGRQTVYYDHRGKVLSREYKYRSGSTFVPSK